MTATITEAQRAARSENAKRLHARRAAEAAAAATLHEEKVEALEPAVAHALEALAAEPPRPVRDAITQAAAAAYTPEQNERDQADVTRLLAAKVAEVYESLGLSPPGDRGDILTQLLVEGDEPNVRPDGILDRDEERRRQEKNRNEALLLMTAPSSKRRTMLEALKASPPLGFVSPDELTFSVNGVTIEVPAGWVEPKRRKDDIDVGCTLVAQWVAERTQARGFEITERRRMKWQQIPDREFVEDARVALTVGRIS